MILLAHTARDFANAMLALLPPGQAWEWPVDGFGDGLMLGMSQELARIDVEANPLLSYAIALHTPAVTFSTIYDYRRVVNIRFPGSIDSGHVQLEHLLRPAVVGSHIGDSLWTDRRIFYIHVRYDSSVINQTLLNEYLISIKQAHISLFFEDIG